MGDIILADWGFEMQDIEGTMSAQERTPWIANSRIHVERVIGVVRVIENSVSLIDLMNLLLVHDLGNWVPNISQMRQPKHFYHWTP